MSADLERRRSLLVAALAALRVKTSEPELAAVHRWLDNWTGLGLIATGMERQGYRLHLTNVAPGTWRATFSSHPMMSAEGFGAGTSANLPIQKTVGEAAREAGVAASARPRRLGARCQEAAWSALKDADSPRAA